LQRSFGVADGGACDDERTARHSRFSRLELLPGLIQKSRHLNETPLCIAAQDALLAGRFLRRVLRTLAAVERVIQRQTIVALLDGCVGARKRLYSALILPSGVAIGACGSGGIDRALGLIHFPCRRRRAGHGDKKGTETCGRQPGQISARHPPEYNLAMKALSVNDRPREKLFRLGAAGLGDNELVAIVLGNGSRSGNSLSVANEVLETTSGLHGIPRTSVDELRRIDGVGLAKAAQVLAAVELGRRTLLRCPQARLQFVTPRETAGYLLPQFGSRPVEHFGLMMLDTRHRLIRTSIISVGTLNSSPAHPREIFREAASAAAAAIVLFHNHPSGDPLPSRDDVDLTRRLVQAGEIMGIDVIDHVILADTRYFSFREAGKL
jgi:DNA repair protein RadC